ncbi:uncharacterized protein K460DRAFT_434460, partial [Cucurbitaria berberidis CBS 394.84]
MHHGFDQPTSSSVSRSTNTGACGQTQQSSTIHKRQAPYETPIPKQCIGEPTQPQSISARRRTDQPALALPQQSGEFRPPSTGHKSPAYLQGKNPYGQVLDKVEHPYREPKHTQTTDGPPSQAGSSSEGRQRTSGSLQFMTRPTPPEPERIVATSDSPPQLLPSRQPRKPVSVQATKIFFENKASQHQSAPPVPPSGAATIAKGASGRIQAQRPQSLALSQPPYTSMSSPTKVQAPEETDSDGALPLSRPPPESDHTDSQRVNPFVRPQAKSTAPDVTTRTTAVSQDSPISDVPGVGSDVEREASSHTTSANFLTDAASNVKDHGAERRAAAASSKSDEVSNAPLIALQGAKRTKQRQTSEETVRRRYTRKSLSATETEEATASNDPKIHPQGRRPKPCRNVRRGFAEGKHFWATAPKRYPAAYRDNLGETVDVRKRLEDIATRDLSHDGSSRRSTTSTQVPIATVGVQPDYHTIEVPDHIDWRAAYGRRKTQDFGFPGARIKPRGTSRALKPLHDPGSWTRRACGHFSYMGKDEHRKFASRKKCRQCSNNVPPSEPEPLYHRPARKRAAADSSTSSSSTSIKYEDACGRPSKRRKHHSECMPADKCGDTFAKDLEYFVDSILEEHTNSLQAVINNLKHSKPNITQLQSVSEDLVQRYQTRSPVCQPASKLHTREWQSPRLYIPPRVAEKLNVRFPGQLGPNMNESRASLRESIKSATELVELVNSAADDLGIDLDSRPSALDEEVFRNAPVEGVPPVSLSSGQSGPSRTEGNGFSEDIWMQQALGQLSELSEEQTRFVEELDVITDDLGVQ